MRKLMSLVNNSIPLLSYLVIFGTLCLAGMAFAQPEASWNVQEWGAGFAGLAGGVVLVMSILRRFLLKGLDGPLVRVVAIGVGIIMGSVLGLIPEQFYNGIGQGAWNGLLGGIASFLGVDAVRDVFHGQNTKGPESGKRPGA